jgi:hypothetical protein
MGRHASALDGDGLQLEQRRLRGVAVDGDDLRGALDAQVERVAAAAGQRQAHVALLDLQHLLTGQLKQVSIIWKNCGRMTWEHSNTAYAAGRDIR